MGTCLQRCIYISLAIFCTLLSLGMVSINLNYDSSYYNKPKSPCFDDRARSYKAKVAVFIAYNALKQRPNQPDFYEKKFKKYDRDSKASMEGMKIDIEYEFFQASFMESRKEGCKKSNLMKNVVKIKEFIEVNKKHFIRYIFIVRCELLYNYFLQNGNMTSLRDHTETLGEDSIQILYTQHLDNNSGDPFDISLFPDTFNQTRICNLFMDDKLKDYIELVEDDDYETLESQRIFWCIFLALSIVSHPTLWFISCCVHCGPWKIFKNTFNSIYYY